VSLGNDWGRRLACGMVLGAVAVGAALVLAGAGLQRVGALVHGEVAAASTGTGTPRIYGAAQATPTIAVSVDDFEEPDWPAGTPWTISMDPEDPRTLYYTWAPRTCRASSGLHSLWAVGGGELGKALACGQPYPPNIRSAVVLSLDLRPYADAAVLRLAFDLWGDTISDAALGDFFTINYLIPNPEGFVDRVPVLDWTGSTGPSSAFVTRRLDLLDLPDVQDTTKRYNLAGQQVQMEFVFRTARDSTFRPEGIFVDNVRLERDGVPTATATSPSPTGTPSPATATSASPTALITASPTTVTPTASAIATAGPSPTEPPGGARIFLPTARRGS
jgi:hypothetical protein